MSATFIIEATVKPECHQQFIDSFNVMKEVPSFIDITLYQDEGDEHTFI